MKTISVKLIVIISLACVSVFGQNYGKIRGHSDGIAKIDKGGLSGLVDIKTKTIILKPAYKRLGNFSEGLAIASTDDDESLYNYSSKPNTTGFINKLGKVEIGFVYQDAKDFSEGLAAVKKKGKWGYINKIGKVVIPFSYEYADKLSEGVALVQQGSDDTKVFFIDKLGNKLSPKMNITGKLSGGVAKVISDRGCGYIDKTGSIIVPLEFSDCNEPKEGLLVFRAAQDLYRVSDNTGKKLFEVSAAEVSGYNEGLAQVTLDDKNTNLFIDETGKVVIPKQNLLANEFSGGLLGFTKKVSEGGSEREVTGYMDKTGKDVIVGDFTFTDKFNGDYALVAEGSYPNRNDYLIDKTGKCVLGCSGEVIKPASVKPKSGVKPAVKKSN